MPRSTVRREIDLLVIIIGKSPVGYSAKLARHQFFR
jgi:hypothetical protein